MSLATYLKQNKMSYEDFGALIGVTGTSVYRYVSGDRRPKKDTIDKIFEITNGTITANDFYQLPKLNGHKKRSRKQ